MKTLATANTIKLFVLTLLIITALLLATACSKAKQGPQGATGATPTVTKGPANQNECPGGGVSISFADGSTTVLCNGTTGPSGGPGPQGATGPAGQDGQTPIISVVAAPTAVCPSGGEALEVNNVIEGIVCNGSAGSPGTNGSNGTDATPVAIVPLCPGSPAYPSVFVEIALCINSNLYGVYSANGGFLTYLPPGGYSSNAIGSACNLTIQPNCVVVN